MKNEQEQLAGIRAPAANGKLHIALRPSTKGKGRIFPAEARIHIDDWTGIRVRQVTTHAATHHHPFVYLPAYDDAMRWLTFVSHRTGCAFCPGGVVLYS